MARDRSADEARGARLRSIREALGLKGLDFVRYLAEHTTVEVGQSELSRMETGMARITVEDVAAWASIDPLKRGRLWLAWGDDPNGAGPTQPVARAAVGVEPEGRTVHTQVRRRPKR